MPARIAGGEPLRIDRAGGLEVDAHHRHIVHRQHVGIRQVDGLATDLHGELRSADDGGANTLAGID